MGKTADLMQLINNTKSEETYKDLHWEGSFEEYLGKVHDDPRIARNAFQRMYDMIVSFGENEIEHNGRTIYSYPFFDDPLDNGKDAIFGLEESLAQLVSVLKAAAHGYGTEKRVILLHGPVGSSKSTVCRLIKKGLEHYSRQKEGALYSFGWQLPEEEDIQWCPMHEDPLYLIPENSRQAVIDSINDTEKYPLNLEFDGFLDPFCQFHYTKLMEHYEGDWSQVIKHIRVKRVLMSEKNRIGIGTFQPKDEKNQDSTELTGDINYRKIALYGSDSDPRAFNFDGEFNIANRGMIEFVEVLKLDVAFLYDLLGASQEHAIKPKKFAQTHIDEVIIGHTNEPEFKKLQSNELMEAFRDRTIKIDIPYITVLEDEIEIYKRDFAPETTAKHIAPHTIETAAMWAILTRLENPNNQQLSILQKMKLYNGKTLHGFTEDNIRELRADASREGMEGISPRYIQDKLSSAMASRESYINPFMVFQALDSGLDHHSLINSDEDKLRYKDLLNIVKQEYEDIVKNEVQQAICADEDAIQRLCGNYIDNVKAYTQREKVRNKYTGQDEEPDERMMRSIEEKINIADSNKDDFRREIMNYIGALAIDGKTFDYKTNERLQKALELKLFEDQKDTIKLTSLVSNVVDKDTQEKIDVVKTRLINSYGYSQESATDVLTFVASIFARGDTK